MISTPPNCLHDVILSITNFVFYFSLASLMVFPVNSYRPTLPVAFIQSELGFTDEEDCKKFLAEVGATLTAQGAKVDCKVALTEV